MNGPFPSFLDFNGYGQKYDLWCGCDTKSYHVHLQNTWEIFVMGTKLKGDQLVTKVIYIIHKIVY